MSRLVREFGRSQASLAAAVGKSRSHIANTVRLLGLPEAVRRSLDGGELSAGHARALGDAPTRRRSPWRWCAAASMSAPPRRWCAAAPAPSRGQAGPAPGARRRHAGPRTRPGQPRLGLRVTLSSEAPRRQPDRALYEPRATRPGIAPAARGLTRGRRAAPRPPGSAGEAVQRGRQKMRSGDFAGGEDAIGLTLGEAGDRVDRDAARRQALGAAAVERRKPPGRRRAARRRASHRPASLRARAMSPARLDQAAGRGERQGSGPISGSMHKPRRADELQDAGSQQLARHERRPTAVETPIRAPERVGRRDRG